MFNLIYIILGIYLIKILAIRINKEYKNLKYKNKDKENDESKSRNIRRKGFDAFKILNPFNKIVNLLNFKNNNCGVVDDNKEKYDEKWGYIRSSALEKSKYKCEECGNISNLDVYIKNNNQSDEEEVIVLCKKCYEKNVGEIRLHYN